MASRITDTTMEGTHSDAITITRMGHAMGVRMVVAVANERRGKNSFQDHQKILSSEEEACLPGRKGKLTMLLVARRNQPMASTTGGGRLKRWTGLPV